MKDYSLLKLKNVSKFYYNKGLVASGFSKVSLEFNLGEFVVITGESGSGKSTLLNVLSGLDSYEEGEMYINGEETSHYNEEDFENYRKTYIGNIFQSFNLVNSYTVYQNIELVLLLNGYKKKDIKNKIISLIKEVDLYKYRNTRVSKLSGGQKQRVAIARALAKDTPIIIADEPTGNLDSKSARSVVKLLSEIAKDKLVIIVTHNYDEVEEFATRKIEMHDGKVREDIELKKYESKEPVIYDYKDISFGSKLLIGVRNTFNIVPKFLLTLFVFLFVTSSFLSEYSSFKQAEYEESKGGYNEYFNNTDDKRIVIKKKNGSPISSSDIESIKKISNVDYVVPDDTILDTQFSLYNDNNSFYGVVESNEKIEKVDIGRLPQNSNEIVLKGYEYDYDLTNLSDKILNNNFYLGTVTGKEVVSNLTVVGIILDSSSYNYAIYLPVNIISQIRIYSNEFYSKMTVTLNDNKYTVGKYDYHMRVQPNENVPKGEAYIDNSYNYLCKYEWCGNAQLKVDIENIYYKESLDLTITKIFTKYTFTNLTGIKDYDYNSERIYISNEDYEKLFDKESYQSSVFANDYKNVDGIIKKLNDSGYITLKIKDTISNDIEEILRIISIFKLILTIVLFIVMFFIAYFVIRLIQKSKNVYYSTVRILGGSKRVIRNFISIELLADFNIAYLLMLTFAMLSKYGILKINYFANITNYLALKDYVVIYIILTAMSYLISIRYARKLFKSSAMKTYNEEV